MKLSELKKPMPPDRFKTAAEHAWYLRYQGYNDDDAIEGAAKEYDLSPKELEEYIGDDWNQIHSQMNADDKDEWDASNYR